MTTKQVSNLLNSPSVSKHKGIFKYWRSYYYHHGMIPQHLVDFVTGTIPNAIIQEAGDHWAQFSGGAKSGSAKDSYLWVTFTIPEA